MSTLFDRIEPTLFHDKAWKRADMPAWDARWQRLSLAARRHVLEVLRTGPQRDTDRPANALSSLAGGTFAELAREGFVLPCPAGFVVAEPAVGFINRVRSLRRLALLDEKQPSQFERYLSQAFATFDLGTVVADVVHEKTGLGRYQIGGDLFELFVRRHSWPEWAADFLKQPAARLLVEAVEKAGSPVPLPRLGELLPEQHPSAVRSAFDALVNHLALFEDIDTATLDIVTGFLPAVQAERRTRRRRKPPTLEPCEPAEVGPEGGIEVPDLRAALLEVSASPPRLKQDHSLFAKEKERFLAALDPLPAWLLHGTEQESREQRLGQALGWAFRLELVQADKGTDQALALTLTEEGRDWLALDREGQYERLFADLRDQVPSRMYRYAPADSAFLASPVQVTADRRGRLQVALGELPLEERQPLREAVHALLAQLPVGRFFPVDAFLNWAGDPARNPLLLGRPASEVVVRLDNRVVPPLDDHLDEACRHLFRNLLTYRLCGLGCVQLARDARGQTAFARLPRLDAYFGLEAQRPASTAATRVIVQPDFSIVVIGLDPGPVADLTPFCDRVQGSSAQGAMTFRLSRESIFRGLAGGLKPDDIPARLRKHAGNVIPQNVMTEVMGWCGLARTVSVGQTTLIRCPDAETAARVAAALGRQGERVGETAVALDGNLTPALRQRLQAQGVIVEGARGKKGK